MMKFEKSLQEINDIRSGKMDFPQWLENNDFGFTPEQLGLTDGDFLLEEFQYKVGDNEEELLKTEQNFDKMELKTINLYKYVSDEYGSSNISESSRDFCKRMVNLTKFGKKLLTFNDILKFNTQNPGLGKGGSNSYSVFNYRGGSNCKHYWLKWKFDTKSGNLVKAPKEQQRGFVPVD